MKFEQPAEGAWIQPRRRGYKLACCDCGLVHRLDFRLYHRRIQFRAFRNRRSTAMMRRWLKRAEAGAGNGQPSRGEAAS